MSDAVAALTGGVQTTEPTTNGTEAGAGGTTGLPEWLASAPEEIKGEKTLQSFKDPVTLAKSYLEARKYIGSSIRLPAADAKPEEWDAIHERLGWPKDPKGYTVTLPQVPESHAFTTEEVEAARATAHALRLTPKQFQAILEREGETRRDAAKAAAEADAARSASRAKTLADLQGRYGADWPAKLAAMQRVLKDAPAAVTDLFESVDGDVQRFFLELAIAGGEARAEDRIVDVPPQASGVVADAKAKIAAIQADMNHPYWKAHDPGHAAAVEEMTRLMGLVHGTKPANLTGAIG